MFAFGEEAWEWNEIGKEHTKNYSIVSVVVL